MEGTEYKITSLIKLLFIVLTIIIVFYGITILVTNNKKKNELEYSESVIQYDEILIGNIYNVTSEEHYVVVGLEKDYLTINNLVNTYKEKKESIKIYTSNLNDVMNKKYLSEESNFETRFPKFKETTLIKISNNRIVEYYEGIDKVKEILE